MDTRMAMWVHGVSVFPQSTAGDVGADGPLTQVFHVPYSDIVGFRQGSGAIFRGKRAHENWFHVSIPTPVLVPIFHRNDRPYGQPIRLDRVFILHRNEVTPENGAKAWIADVHVWDGGTEPHYDTSQSASGFVGQPVGGDESEPLRIDNFSGEHHLHIQDGWNTWTLRSGRAPITPLIRWGVGISILVHFAQESDFQFVAAGADFLIEIP